ncbi:MAG: transcription antitermination factor NusB [Heliobacteriaceae bacterium]|nr:transcription antitermination factor NusB [Heliobacteriaceae bacterium]
MSRRLGRETALQTLFQYDVGKIDSGFALRFTCEEFQVSQAAADFARELVEGTIARQAVIDATIRRLAVEWDLERMANVDRNLLRIAIYEMLFRPDIPGNVSINEALELAKMYSGEAAVRFVNGILGQLAREQREVSSLADEDEGLEQAEWECRP